eukprot:766716-Hanusia_phi.AAC.5
MGPAPYESIIVRRNKDAGIAEFTLVSGGTTIAEHCGKVTKFSNALFEKQHKMIKPGSCTRSGTETRQSSSSTDSP